MNSSPARPQLLRWTRFASDHNGTGPEKRSAQIKELAKAAGFTLADIVPPASTPRLPTLLAGLRARLRYGARASVSPAGIGLLGFNTLFYRQALATHCGARVLLWETTYDDMLPDLARRAGYRVIALPHNLESLVSERVFADATYDPIPDLAAEVRRLRRADRVFTISREERWLLEARGLKPAYLPFFPTGALAVECARIRARRVALAGPDGRVSGPLLLIGSAFNPATARGMKHQLEWLRAAGSASAEVAVVGPKSDVVLADFATPSVSILGGVPRERLVTLLETCSALLIHTHGGGGAVTRIPEALLSGLPVIANSNAARDQHGTPGVHSYETADEFAALVASPPPIPPTPPPPLSAIRFFQDTLSSLVS
jgi:hypothetical protein